MPVQFNRNSNIIITPTGNVALDPSCCCGNMNTCADPSVDHYLYICPYTTYCPTAPFIGTAINIGPLVSKTISITDISCGYLLYYMTCLPYYDTSCSVSATLFEVELEIVVAGSNVGFAISHKITFTDCLSNLVTSVLRTTYLFSTTPAYCVEGIYYKGVVDTALLYQTSILGCGGGSGGTHFDEPVGTDTPNGFYVAPLARMPVC